MLLQVVLAILEYCLILWLIRFEPEEGKINVLKYFKKSVVSPLARKKDSLPPEASRYSTPAGTRRDSDIGPRMMKKTQKIDMCSLMLMPIIFSIVSGIYFADGYYHR